MELKFKLPKDNEIIQVGTRIWFMFDNKPVQWVIWSIIIKQWEFQNRDYKAAYRWEIGSTIDYEIHPLSDTLISKTLSSVKKWFLSKEDLIQSL